MFLLYTYQKVLIYKIFEINFKKKLIRRIIFLFFTNLEFNWDKRDEKYDVFISSNNIFLFSIKQSRISELIQNSGDNSAQLTSLNENLKEKEKLVEDLQINVSNLQQELNTALEQTQHLENANSKFNFEKLKWRFL